MRDRPPTVDEKKMDEKMIAEIVLHPEKLLPQAKAELEKAKREGTEDDIRSARMFVFACENNIKMKKKYQDKE